MQRESDENSQLYVVCYASRKLLPHERNYAVVELEMLAIVYCITTFHQYIYSHRVQIPSDHRPLEHLNSLVKHSSRLARYRLILQNYDIECKYVIGCEQMADALTRMHE